MSRDGGDGRQVNDQMTYTSRTIARLVTILGCVTIFLSPSGSAQITSAVPATHGYDVTIYVNNQLGSDAFDGSWLSPMGGNVGPKRTLSAAIALASTGQTISVAGTGISYDEISTGAKSLRFTSYLASPTIRVMTIGAATLLSGPFQLADSGTLTLLNGVLTGAHNLTVGNGGTVVQSGGSLSAGDALSVTSYDLTYRTRGPVTSTSDEFIAGAVSSLTISDSGTVLTVHADRKIGNLTLDAPGGGIVLGRSDGTSTLSLSGNATITAGTFISRTLTSAAIKSPAIAFVGTSPQTITVPSGEYLLPDGFDSNKDGDYLDAGDVPPVDVEINNLANADADRTITLTGGNLWMAGIGRGTGGTVWLKSGIVITGSNAWHLSQGKNLATNVATQGFVWSPPSGAFSHFAGNVSKFVNATDLAIRSTVTFPVGTLASPRACYRPLTFDFRKGAGSASFNLTVSHEDSRPTGTMAGFPIYTENIVISDYADFDWYVRSDISLAPSQQYGMEVQAQGYIGYLQDGIQNVRLIRRDRLFLILPEWKPVMDYLTNHAPVYENSIIAADWPVVNALNINGGITTQGSIFTFGKGSGGSFAITRSPSNITANSATLNGQIYPTSATCTVWFEWGTSSTLSAFSSTTTQSPGNGTSPLLISANLSGLTPNTIYFFRIAGRDTGEVARGPIYSFTTATNPAQSGPTLLLPADTARNVSLTPTLSWSAVAGASFYEIQVSQSYGFTTFVYDDTTSGLSQTVGPLNRDSKYYWRVRAITGSDFGPFSTIRIFDTTPITAVGRLDGETPVEYALAQNYPNPFNPTTAISYQLSAISFVTLKVFDILGTEIANLVNDVRSAGTYTVQWDASSFPSGTYVYRLQAGSFIETRKMILLK